MSMGQQEDRHILHGNLAKAEKDKNRILPQIHRASSGPNQYGFASLPGSTEDLKKARAPFKDETKQEKK